MTQLRIVRKNKGGTTAYYGITTEIAMDFETALTPTAKSLGYVTVATREYPGVKIGDYLTCVGMTEPHNLADEDDDDYGQSIYNPAKPIATRKYWRLSTEDEIRAKKSAS